MNITVVGAGNMGLAMTAYMAYNNKGSITLYTEKPLPGEFSFYDVEGNMSATTSNFTVTGSKDEAFSNADIIFCTYPAFLRQSFVKMIEKFVKPGAYIGFVPGYGGAEYACKDIIKNGVRVFGLQRVPYVARAQKSETLVNAGILSKKSTLYVAAIPYEFSADISQKVGQLLDIPTVCLKEYLAITLAPSNPLLHITGVYTAFKDYAEGVFYPEEIPFYEQWTDETSRILFDYDTEVQNICNKLQPLDLSEVVSLPIYYESSTPEAMTRKLQSIESFKAVRVPLKKTENGSIPDLNNRMFIEDFPFGVCVLKAFAIITAVDTPVIDMMLAFYKKLSGIEYITEDNIFTGEMAKCGIPQNYGLNTINDIIDFYKTGIIK